MSGISCCAVPDVYRVRDTIYLGLAVVLFMVYTEYVTKITNVFGD